MGGFNGSGLYQRYYNWGQDASAGIDISSSRMDTEDNGFATGLSNCITKDGQQTVTADIGFNGFKVKNIANATLSTDAVNVQSLQSGSFINAGTTSGTNTYTFGLTPALSAYASGQTFRVIIGTTNTGASTGNCNSLGAKNILKKTLGGLVAVAANDLIAGQEYDLFYDGTQLQVSGSNLDPSFTVIFSGSIMPFAGSSAPSGWLLCYGQAISRTSNAALFAVIGTTYGAGDGSTTFNVPDLRGRSIAGVDNMGGTAANRITSGNSGIQGTTLGASGGNEQLHGHTHTATSVPTDPGHAHTIFGGASGAGSFYGEAVNNATSQNTTTSVTGITVATTIASTGGGSSQNVQPTIMLNYIIKT